MMEVTSHQFFSALVQQEAGPLFAFIHINAVMVLQTLWSLQSTVPKVAQLLQEWTTNSWIADMVFDQWRELKWILVLSQDSFI